MKTFIYGLIDPNTKIIRYIGKSDMPKTRLSNHIQTSKKSKTHKSNWINSLIKNKQKPIIIILEEVKKENWEEREIYWIQKYKDDGYDVTNFTSGGEGGEKIYFIDKDELYQKYISENLSINECVEYFKIPQTTIYRNLVEYEIKKDKEVWQKQCTNKTSSKGRILKRNVILQYNLNGIIIKEHNGLIEAMNSVNAPNPSNISQCCLGKKMLCYGFIWKYKKDNIIIDKKYLDNLYSDYENNKRKKVIRYDLKNNYIEEYISITEASKKTGIGWSPIGACCKHKTKTAGGFIWKYK